MRLQIHSPSFLGYWRSIARGFEEIGYEVDVHCYDALPTMAAKVRNKVSYEWRERRGLPSTRKRDHTARAIAARHRVTPAVVLVVKGDSLTQEFWDAVGRRPHAVWLYDAISLTSYTAEGLAALGPTASFSRSDTARLIELGATAIHVPLAFDPSYGIPGNLPRSTEVVFAGARYPNREQLLLDLYGRGIPVRAYGRTWSHHPYDRLRTWDLTRPEIPSHREVDLAAALRLMAAAPATLNVHSLSQDGFTMRTFEAGGVGALHIIDRDDVSEFYDPGTEVVVYHDIDELYDLCQRAIGDHAWGQQIRQAARLRTLATHTFTHRAQALEQLWR